MYHCAIMFCDYIRNAVSRCRWKFIIESIRFQNLIRSSSTLYRPLHHRHLPLTRGCRSSHDGIGKDRTFKCGITHLIFLIHSHRVRFEDRERQRNLQFAMESKRAMSSRNCDECNSGYTFNQQLGFTSDNAKKAYDFTYCSYLFCRSSGLSYDSQTAVGKDIPSPATRFSI